MRWALAISGLQHWSLRSAGVILQSQTSARFYCILHITIILIEKSIVEEYVIEIPHIDTSHKYLTKKGGGFLLLCNSGRGLRAS